MTGTVTPYLKPSSAWKSWGPPGWWASTLVDTGFTDFLSLPLSLVRALGLAYLLTDKVFPADGSEIAVDQYEVTVILGRTATRRERALPGRQSPDRPLTDLGSSADHAGRGWRLGDDRPYP